MYTRKTAGRCRHLKTNADKQDTAPYPRSRYIVCHTGLGKTEASDNQANSHLDPNNKEYENKGRAEGGGQLVLSCEQCFILFFCCLLQGAWPPGICVLSVCRRMEACSSEWPSVLLLIYL